MRFPWIVGLVVLIGAGLSFWVGVQRHRLEAGSRAVHVVAEFDDVEALAIASGLSVRQALLRLRDAGLTGVSVQEETFGDFFTSGRLIPVPGAPNAPARLVARDKSTADRLKRVIRERFGEVARGPYVLLLEGGALRLPFSLSELWDYGIGLDPEKCQLVRECGLSLVGRVANPPYSGRAMIKDILRDLHVNRVEGVIFLGDSVLGSFQLVEEVAEGLRAQGMWYGSIEFGKQAGDSRLSLLMLPEVFRVHSISSAEMMRLSREEAIERYVRAGTERNIRVCYVRPWSPSHESPLEGFANFLESLRARLEREGSAARAPNFVRAPEVPFSYRLGISACAWLFAVWFGCVYVLRLWGRRVGAVGSAFLVACGSALFLASWLTEDFRLSALVSALVFPTFGMILCCSWREGARGGWLLAGVRFLGVCGFSVVGGMYVSALLTELPYMMNIQQFLGVKVAHVLPLVGVGVYLLLQRERVYEVVESPVRWVHMALLLVVCLAFLLLLVRTGNEPPTSVPGWEMQVRNLLDQWLPERPRTKEVLLGHPALMLTLWCVFRRRERFLPLLAMLATVGQVSIVNTFAHLHTPIEVSVKRVLVGVVLGLVLGGILFLIASLGERRRGPSES
jgi:hypothetical protein